MAFIKRFKKKYVLPLTAAVVLFTGAGFTYRDDFFEIAKQIEIFTTLYKTVNTKFYKAGFENRGMYQTGSNFDR